MARLYIVQTRRRRAFRSTSISPAVHAQLRDSRQVQHRCHPRGSADFAPSAPGFAARHAVRRMRPAPLREQRQRQRPQKFQSAARRRRRRDAGPRRPNRGESKTRARAPDSVAPESPDRSAACSSCAPARRSRRARRPSRRCRRKSFRSSRTSRRRTRRCSSCPGWPPARPSAPSSTSTTRCDVSTLPPDDGRRRFRRRPRLGIQQARRQHDFDRPQHAVIERNVLVDQQPQRVDHRRRHNRPIRVEIAVDDRPGAGEIDRRGRRAASCSVESVNRTRNRHARAVGRFQIVGECVRARRQLRQCQPHLSLGRILHDVPCTAAPPATSIARRAPADRSRPADWRPLGPRRRPGSSSTSRVGYGACKQRVAQLVEPRLAGRHDFQDCESARLPRPDSSTAAASSRARSRRSPHDGRGWR